VEEKIRAHIFVSGRVQGVFFRVNTVQEAEKLGILGWVKNLEDGRVEAVLEGDSEKVKGMVEWLKKGPPAAKVEHLDVQFEDYKGEFKNFEKVKRWQIK
jgi:acylphosphatase